MDTNVPSHPLTILEWVALIRHWNVRLLCWSHYQYCIPLSQSLSSLFNPTFPFSIPLSSFWSHSLHINPTLLGVYLLSHYYSSCIDSTSSSWRAWNEDQVVQVVRSHTSLHFHAWSGWRQVQCQHPTPAHWSATATDTLEVRLRCCCVCPKRRNTI